MFPSLIVPHLPDDSQLADQPDDIILPLYPHQRAALQRMRAIEKDSNLGNHSKMFSKQVLSADNKYYISRDYTALGGCLAEGVGMGKTATVLALICSSPEDASKGPNLVVAPSHLLGQWEEEAAKYSPIALLCDVQC